MLTSLRRWVPGVLVLAMLGVAGFLLGPRARAEDVPSTPKVPESWVYDVRVVRVDTTDPAVVETAPPWKAAGTSAASTSSPWSDLLAGLKARGRTTILLDQRVTAGDGIPTEVKHRRKRSVLALRARAGNAETWETSFLESGTSGELVATAHGLHYTIDVTWEDAPKADGTGSVSSASWKGTRFGGAPAETLVLSHRQQQVSESAEPRGLEIYVFMTGTPGAPR